MPDGSFTQFARVQDRQLLGAAEASHLGRGRLLTLTLATSYRMLFGHRPHTLKPGHNVLVWGASGGLGSMAVQLIATTGANAVGVVSDDKKRRLRHVARRQGRDQPQQLQMLGQMPAVGTPEYDVWLKETRNFGKAIWEITGKGVNVDCVFEHPGEATFPVSCFVYCGGMVVFCAGTTGYNLTMDARYVWMHQKRVQGSHFAHLLPARARRTSSWSSAASIRACRKCSPGSRSPRRICG